MLQRTNKRAIVRLALIPPAVARRERRRDHDFIYRREQAHPRVTLRECAGVLCKELWPIWILKIANPVRHAEVAEIGDGKDFSFAQRIEGFVGETPVVLSHASVCRKIGRAV